MESSVSSASASAAFVRYVVARRYTNDMSLSCFSSVAIEFSPRIPFPNITQISKPKLIMPSRSRKKHERGHLGGFLTLFHSCFFFFACFGIGEPRSPRNKARRRKQASPAPKAPRRLCRQLALKRIEKRKESADAPLLGEKVKKDEFFSLGAFFGGRERRESVKATSRNDDEDRGEQQRLFFYFTLSIFSFFYSSHSLFTKSVFRNVVFDSQDVYLVVPSRRTCSETLFFDSLDVSFSDHFLFPAIVLFAFAARA